MTELNYRDIVNRSYKGQILIGVDPALARRFFTDTNHMAVRQQIGEPLFLERFLVNAAWLGEYACLLAGVIASVLALRWYSAIAIPLIVAGSLVLGGAASVGRQRLRGAIFLILVFSFLAYLFRGKGTAVVVWLVLLPLPYCFARLTYKLATVFLRLLSLRNQKVFELLHGKAIFPKEIE